MNHVLPEVDYSKLPPMPGPNTSSGTAGNPSGEYVYIGDDVPKWQGPHIIKQPELPRRVITIDWAKVLVWAVLPPLCWAIVFAVGISIGLLIDALF